MPDNYVTREVSQWILNDEGLYNLARSFRNRRNPYPEFVESLRECGVTETPYSRISYNDSGIDVAEMNELIREL